MSDRLTDRIRSYVISEYVVPARKQGKRKLSVSVRDVRSGLAKHESMRGKSVVICQALQSKKFMDESAMVVESIDGPPSKKSTTVVMHYELVGQQPQASGPESEITSPEKWAAEMVGKLFGLLKDEMAEYGGGEAYLRWVRSEEKEPK